MIAFILDSRYNSSMNRRKEMQDVSPRLTQFIETVALPFAVGFLFGMFVIIERFA
jgi:hypothetical protein